jgi:hypothetical protein
VNPAACKPGTRVGSEGTAWRATVVATKPGDNGKLYAFLSAKFEEWPPALLWYPVELLTELPS